MIWLVFGTLLVAGVALGVSVRTLLYLRETPAPLSLAMPEGPAAPPVPDRSIWLAVRPAEDARTGSPRTAGSDPRLVATQAEAVVVARQLRGVVANLPLVADYREDPTPAPTYNSRVRWEFEVRESAPEPLSWSDSIPPGGPIIIEHQDTEDDGSVTIWFRRVDAG